MVSAVNNKDTVFPCRHESADKNTMNRCVVCRMPVSADCPHKTILNGEALFCCKECEEYYLKELEELGVI